MRRGRAADPPSLLIVDSDAECHELVGAMLANRAIRIFSAYHGHDAMDWLTSTRVDLILFGMFGPAGIRRQIWDVLVQRKIPEIIPIILTAKIPDEEGAELARVLGAKGFLRKPFPKRAFLAVAGPILGLDD